MNLDELHEEPVDLEADGTALLPPQHAGYGRFMRTRVEVVPQPQTLERRRGFVARWAAWLSDQHKRWYRSDEERQRHAVEEDARRLGGHVVWDEEGL